MADDEPITFYDFIALTAEAWASGRPRRIPAALARLVAGRDPVITVTRSAKTSNARLKRELGWAPRYPTAREGVPAVVAELGAELGEQRPRAGDAGLERGAEVVLGLGEHPQRQAVTQREERDGDRLGVGVEAQDALVVLGLEQAGDVAARAAVELGDLGGEVGRAARGAEELEDQRDEVRIVLDEVLELADQNIDDVLRGARARQRAVEERRAGCRSRGATTSTSRRSLVPK